MSDPLADKLPGNPYDVHPGLAMVQTSIANLRTRTGKSLEEWIQVLNDTLPEDEVTRRDWLKQKAGLGTNYAWWVAERSVGKGWEDDDPVLYLQKAIEYVDDMFAGPKTALRPIYEALYDLGKALGPDVRVCPCKTMVPFYRKNVFAQVKPSTRTRIDFGFALKDTPASGRLKDTGGLAKGDRITHQIPLTTVEEVDEEVKRFLLAAYEMAK